MFMTTRRQFSGQEKMQILRLHLLGHKLISEVCQQYDLNPNVFYRWQQELFEIGLLANGAEEAHRPRRAFWSMLTTLFQSRKGVRSTLSTCGVSVRSAMSVKARLMNSDRRWASGIITRSTGVHGCQLGSASECRLSKSTLAVGIRYLRAASETAIGWPWMTVRHECPLCS